MERCQKKYYPKYEKAILLCILGVIFDEHYKTGDSTLKKKILKVIMILIVLIGILFLLNGFTKPTDVFLEEYSVSKDGLSLSLHVGIASSMGYTRGYNIRKENESEYITFYSTFGGFNSSMGAENEFEVELDPACTKLFFYRGDDRYQQVLQKNAQTNKWERIKE